MMLSEIPPARVWVALERTMKALQGEHFDADDFLGEFEEQIKTIFADEMLGKLSAQGTIEVIGVDDDGELIWSCK